MGARGIPNVGSGGRGGWRLRTVVVVAAAVAAAVVVAAVAASSGKRCGADANGVDGTRRLSSCRRRSS
jgi:hypothetical protein